MVHPTRASPIKESKIMPASSVESPLKEDPPKAAGDTKPEEWTHNHTIGAMMALTVTMKQLHMALPESVRESLRSGLRKIHAHAASRPTPEGLAHEVYEESRSGQMLILETLIGD